MSGIFLQRIQSHCTASAGCGMHMEVHILGHMAENMCARESIPIKPPETARGRLATLHPIGYAGEFSSLFSIPQTSQELLKRGEQDIPESDWRPVGAGAQRQDLSQRKSGES